MDLTAVVVGAGQGMGKATALLLAQNGFHVYLVGRTRHKLEAVARQIEETKGKCTVVEADLTQEHALKPLGDLVEAQGGRLDAVISCAGEALIKPIEETTFEEWNHILAVNLSTAYLVTNRLLPFLRRSANPSLVFLVSKVALKGYATVTAYSAAKAGLLGFTRSLAAELRAEHIRVTAICPGPVDTPMRWAATPDMDAALVIKPESIAELVWHIIKLPRGTTLGEILIQSDLYD